MAGLILPVAKELYLCEEIDREGGLVNLYGLINAFHRDSFPHIAIPFCVFAQLSQGLGEIRFHFDISRARDGTLIHVSESHSLEFARRTQLHQIAMTFDGILFEEPGVYLIELFCDNTPIADVALELFEEES